MTSCCDGTIEKSIIFADLKFRTSDIILEVIHKSITKMEKKDLLKNVVEHIDIKSYDSTQLINAMRKMSFTSRDTARAADILSSVP